MDIYLAIGATKKLNHPLQVASCNKGTVQTWTLDWAGIYTGGKKIEPDNLTKNCSQDNYALKT